MKLQDFDFRICDKTKEEFLKKEPTLIKIDNERVIAGRISRFYANTADITDMFIGNGNDLEIELWTGIYDKNGKKIYEGDIVKTKSPYDCFLAKVGIHKEGTFYLESKSRDYIGSLIYLVKDEGYDTEIIGNIHENPELLKC
ncbi:TPA: YopX family protein [Campylobacter jejuni]